MGFGVWGLGFNVRVPFIRFCFGFRGFGGGGKEEVATRWVGGLGVWGGGVSSQEGSALACFQGFCLLSAVVFALRLVLCSAAMER